MAISKKRIREWQNRNRDQGLLDCNVLDPTDKIAQYNRGCLAIFSHSLAAICVLFTTHCEISLQVNCTLSQGLEVQLNIKTFLEHQNLSVTFVFNSVNKLSPSYIHNYFSFSSSLHQYSS